MRTARELIEPTEVRRGVWLVGLVFGGAAAGMAATVVPTLALLAIALVLAVVLAWSAPELALTAGAMLTLVAPDSAFPALQLGSAVLIVGGATCVLRQGLEHARSGSWNAVLPAVVALTWLSLRLGIESGDTYLRSLAACAGAVALGYCTVARDRDWTRALALAALFFVVVSALLGQTDGTGLRFQGVSGNPNRMVFGALICTVVLISQLIDRRSRLWSLVCAAGVAGCAYLVVVSGSDQGLVGLAGVAFALTIFLTRRAMGPLVAIGLGVVSIVAMVLVIQMGQLLAVDPDLRTLSGRTLTYRAGWQEFLANPVFGSGQLRVTQDTVVERSTHNSLIGIAAATGIVGAVAWLVVLVIVAFRATARLRAGYFAPAVGLIVCLTQLVQSIQLVPITWAVIVLVSATARAPKDRHASN